MRLLKTKLRPTAKKIEIRIRNYFFSCFILHIQLRQNQTVAKEEEKPIRNPFLRNTCAWFVKAMSGVCHTNTVCKK